MTPEISAAIKDWANKMVPDEAARKWMYEGGALNPPRAVTLPSTPRPRCSQCSLS